VCGIFFRELPIINNFFSGAKLHFTKLRRATQNHTTNKKMRNPSSTLGLVLALMAIVSQLSHGFQLHRQLAGASSNSKFQSVKLLQQRQGLPSISVNSRYPPTRSLLVPTSQLSYGGTVYGAPKPQFDPTATAPENGFVNGPANANPPAETMNAAAGWPQQTNSNANGSFQNRNFRTSGNANMNAQSGYAPAEGLGAQPAAIDTCKILFSGFVGTDPKDVYLKNDQYIVSFLVRRSVCNTYNSIII
jgi:hypothetical protein